MENHIELYNTISTAFLMLMIIFLIAAVVLFFVLDIRRVVGVLSGRAARRSIQELEKRNAVTGQLRSNSGEVSPQPVRKLEDVIAYPQTEKIVRAEDASSGAAAAVSTAENPAEGNYGETSVLVSEPDQSHGRFVLLANEMLVHTSEVI